MRKRKAASAAIMCAAALMCLLLPACESDPKPRPSTAAERSERALQDPFNYSPFEKKKSSVSGGGIGELDRDGLKKDMNNVFNP